MPAAYAAWIWAFVFLLAHFYWYAGGGVLRPSLPPASLDVFGLAVVAMFAVGLVAPLAAARRWRIPRPLVAAVLWAGAAVLLARGAAGVVDEALRVTGLADGGLTGLTREQVTGFAHPSAGVLWTGRAIDAWFLLGGLLYGAAARAHTRFR